MTFKERLGAKRLEERNFRPVVIFFIFEHRHPQQASDLPDPAQCMTAVTKCGSSCPNRERLYLIMHEGASS